jgi:N6-L-threonylcarbamoyladenine synthase
MSEQVVHILAIESSCDDTSVAVVRGALSDDVPTVLGLAVQSQFEVHEKFGGVVPELASRAHLRNVIPCIAKVLTEARIGLNQISAFAATQRPGLIGCLLIGHTAAKTLSFLQGKPLLSCHHIHAHLMSVFLENQIEFPFLAAVVSGGHTSLYRVRAYDDFEEVGVTLDDAMGEAFDKGAKLLGLPFPGGPEIDRIAKNGNSKAFQLGRVNVPDLNFSFSGLKSEMQRQVKKWESSLTSHREDLAASFQAALVDHLLDKVSRALQQFNLQRFALVGGVARNSEIRRRLEAMKASGQLQTWYAPSPQLCTDNAAMVGALAFRDFKKGSFSDLTSDVFSTERPKKRRLG